MKRLNLKPNLRKFLTEKMKAQKRGIKNIPISSPGNNFNKQKSSHTKSNKIMEKLSLLNSLKGNETQKVTKTIKNDNSKNVVYNFNNPNSLLKEIYRDCNNFRKSKTTDKSGGNNAAHLLMGYQETQSNNNNKKVIIKQNNLKRFNLSISKIPKYDNSSFKQVMKYFTVKTESRTIQIEDLATYLRPIRNILGMPNKSRKENNESKSIKVDNHCGGNRINKNEKNSRDNSSDNNENIVDPNANYNSIAAHDDEDENTSDNKQNYKFNNSHKRKNTLIKNNAFKSNIPYTQRMNKISQVPFNIKIDKIDNTNKGINLNENKSNNKTSLNNVDSTNNNIIISSSKNVSEYETQISTNNNLNNVNQENKTQETQSQTLNQFRPRKMHLPKTGINLSFMQFKNQILHNLLNKRKQCNKI